MNLQYWYMLPISIVVAATAMASGIEGATFFTPIFMLGLGLSPEVAIGTGLITQVFGFTTGLYTFSRQRLIDYQLGLKLLMVTVPAAIIGSGLSGVIEPLTLKLVLGVGLLAVGANFLRTPLPLEIGMLDQKTRELTVNSPRTCLVTAAGEEICYTACNHREGRLIAGIGSFFMGMVSTGLGEMNGYYLLRRCRVPSKIAVPTSVFVVAITALVASTGHLVGFVQTGGRTLTTVLSLVIFTVPGVVVGGLVGALFAQRIPQRRLEHGLGVLLILVAFLTLGQVLRG